MKTLYVSDLDGTLLNSSTQLSERTVASLNDMLHYHDINFTVATARTPATVTRLMERVDTKLPYIVMAGAAFWDNAHREYSYARIIDNRIIARLLDIFGDSVINPFIYRRHGSCIYAHHVHHITPEEREFISERQITSLKKMVYDDVLTPNDKDGAMLVMSMGCYDELRRIADEIDRRGISCTYMCYHDIFDQSQGFLEIYAHGTTKAAAIRQMAEEIKADRTVVFGDNLNDIPMMRIADCSVAVGNAFDEVKEYASEVTLTNDEDAVVRWIENDLKKQGIMP